MSFKVTIKPTKNHLEELKNWLFEEDKISNEGFFCNWEIIEDSFQKNRLIVLTENNSAIGFLTFHFSDNIVNIEIAEIRPDKRKNGNGRKLLEGSFNWFVENGILVAQLYCSPESSEKIWKKLGFLNFPPGIIKSSKLYLYKIIVETTELYKGKKETELIEMWNFEDYRNEVQSTWKWEVKRKEKSNELVKPIIYPCSDEWSVSHSKNLKIQEKTIMKNFDMKRHDGGYFLIIKELEE